MAETKIRVEIKDREWAEFVFHISDSGVVQDCQVKARGCLPLTDAVRKAAKRFHGQNVKDLEWSESQEHWDQFILEVIAKLKGLYVPPYTEDELCHCRKVPTQKVVEAIMIGAHTPEKVTLWTGASTGCGTCRPQVEELIKFRVAQKCQKKA